MSLPAPDQERLELLKELVSIRVEEYFEKPQEENTSIPFGNIEYELTQAARYVMRQVPRNISFFGTRDYDYGIIEKIDSKNGALIPLPSDYSRFTRFKMQGWTRSVNEYLSDVSKAYEQQQFSLRRGTIEKPVVFLTPCHQKFEAGQAPAILAVQTLGKAIPKEGDALTDSDSNEVALISDVDDPDFIYVQNNSGGAYTPEAGDVLTHEETLDSGATISYTISIRYLAGDPYYRQPDSRQALEVYPYAAGEVDELVYVPYMKPWEVPQEFEDILVWRATAAVLTTMRRNNDAKVALNNMVLAQQAINTGIYGEERSMAGDAV